MNRSDFYNDKRKERKINFLSDYRVVSRYLCKKHNIARAEFEMLLKMHSMGTFLRADFDSAQGVFPWSGKRWFTMQPKWVKVHRERKPSIGRNYKTYTITTKAKDMVEDCYRILCGEMSIPEEKRYNPIMKEETYSDKKYAEAIRAFNLARENL